MSDYHVDTKWREYCTTSDIEESRVHDALSSVLSQMGYVFRALIESERGHPYDYMWVHPQTEQLHVGPRQVVDKNWREGEYQVEASGHFDTDLFDKLLQFHSVRLDGRPHESREGSTVMNLKTMDWNVRDNAEMGQGFQNIVVREINWDALFVDVV